MGWNAVLHSIVKRGSRKCVQSWKPFVPLYSRCFSNLPEETVYGGPKHQSPSKRFTLRHVEKKYKDKQPISVVTAYDYPSAVHVDMAGVDICLVGDSAAMVVHGFDTTLPITLEEMLVHCRAVSRGAKRPLLIGDLPFGSFETNSIQAVESSTRMLKEGNMDGVKIEGGGEGRIDAIRSCIRAGIAVMGHIGLTPQAISMLGGFRPQGGTAQSAIQLLEQAKALEQAGCFSLVLECLPAPVSAMITSSISIPTIGIGAGPFCSGQVLVYHDLLGMMQHPHHAKVTPKFAKQYAKVGDVIHSALREYCDDVETKRFPSLAFSPYKMKANEVNLLIKELENRGHKDVIQHVINSTPESNESGYDVEAKEVPN